MNLCMYMHIVATYSDSGSIHTYDMGDPLRPSLLWTSTGHDGSEGFALAWSPTDLGLLASVYICIYVYICIHKRWHAYIYIHVYIHVFFLHVYVCICVCTPTCVYIHTRIDMWTYTGIERGIYG